MWQPAQYTLPASTAFATRIVIGAVANEKPVPTLICNQDPNNSVYLGQDGFGIDQLNVTIIPAGGNVIVDGQDDIWALAPNGAAIQVAPNALVFQVGSTL